MVSQDRRHLFVIPWAHSNLFVEEGGVRFHVYAGVVDKDVQVFVSLLDHVPEEPPREINIKNIAKICLKNTRTNTFVQSND